MRIGTLDQVLTGGHDAVEWGEHMRLAHELGFAGLELGVGADYARTQLWDAAGRRELCQRAQAEGVVICSVCLHAFWRLSPASPDESVRVQALQMTAEACQAAAEVGAQHLLVPLTCPEGVPAEAARERWVASLCESAGAAEAAGVVLCVENVGRAFANEHADIAAIVDAVASPAVQVYYDPGNAVHYGTDPLAGIDVFGPRIAQVHVKEMGGALLGEGHVPWPALLAGLRRIGYDGWLVLETEATDDPAKAAIYNRQVLQKLLAE